METKLKVQYLATDKLIVNPNNPRIIKDAQFQKLCQSIKDNPDYFETRPILCNKQMVIFAGNMRYRAAQDIGLKEVPVVVMDISEERQKEIMIRDNRDNGEWDFSILANEFDEQDLLKWGFDENELGTPNIIDDIGLPDGDKPEFQQMTFTLTDEQATIVKQALVKAKREKFVEGENDNKNGNAIGYICKLYVDNQG